MKRFFQFLGLVGLLFAFQFANAQNPTVKAPTTPYPAADVLSFIEGTYPEWATLSNSNWGETATWDYTSAGTGDDVNSCLVINGLSGSGDPNKRWLAIRFNGNGPIKNYQYVHVDVYCNEPTSFRIGFNSWAPDPGAEEYFPTIQPTDMTPGKWYSIEYPLGEFMDRPTWGAGRDAHLLRFGNVPSDEPDIAYSDEIYVANFFVFNGQPLHLDGTVSSSLKEVTVDDFTIYPTLVSDAFNWKSSKEIREISVYNVTGQLQKRVENVKDAVDVSGLSAGTYVVSVRFADGTSGGRRIVKN
ncbi:MAG: T9SS type A sorting domain-containing protein [Dysgonamonadaceae bacterium]|jgi:hypothetical protein|nr:T9SS type A sorting domain-containing protein [Dysgonamonadaceae bacterium]